MFVAFSAEEIGSSGSRHFIEEYIQPNGIDVRAMINLDIIGGSTEENSSVNNDAIRLYSAGPEDSPSRRLARAIELICHDNATPMAIMAQDSVDRPGRFGDHKQFSDAGYPSVRFIEVTEHTNHQHNGLDTVEYIQPAYLLHATQTILAAVIVLADGPTVVA
jgi:Zn-dependent M28 family amino/carboxypeptidase